jgi:hypothetical protein
MSVVYMMLPWRGTNVHAAIFEGHGLLKANWQFLNTCATETV